MLAVSDRPPSVPCVRVGFSKIREKVLHDNMLTKFLCGQLSHEAFLVLQGLLWSAYAGPSTSKLFCNPAGVAAKRLLEKGVSPEQFEALAAQPDAEKLRTIVMRLTNYEAALALRQPVHSDLQLYGLCQFNRGTPGAPKITCVRYTVMYRRFMERN